MKYEYILVIMMAFMFGPSILKYITFKISRYGEKTGNSYLKAMNDKGTQGEYLVYRSLKRVQRRNGGKILANAYIPKNNGLDKSEIDLIYIAKTGIYVIESKNYGGAIYGSEKENYWTQYIGRKTFEFYNPIKQNLGHIYSLKAYLGKEFKHDDFTSLIVFSDRCELKKINIISKKIKIVKRNKIMKVLNNEIKNGKIIISDDEINSIYKTLEPLTNLSEEEKEKHEKRISVKYGGI